MNLMNLYNIRFPFNPPQPQRTEDLQGAGGSGPSGEKFKLLTLLNYRQYNPRTSWEHGYPLDPLEHFSGSVHYHAAFFQSGNKNCHEDKTLINQK